MAQDIRIPKLGMTMTEAKVVEWKAQEGQWVDVHEVVLVIETEKVTYEVESPGSGFLHILHPPGTVLAVGELAGILAQDEAELAALQGEQPPKEARAADASGEARPPRIKASPIARRLAEQHGIDLSTVEGTGPGGRIVRADVEAAIQTTKEAQEVREAPSAVPEEGEALVLQGRRAKVTVPLSGMRKAIAEHMHRSLAQSAQLTTMAEMDMQEMVRLRQALLERESSLGQRISYTDLFVYIIARALRDHPLLNASLIGEEIYIWDDVNIGVAVALQRGPYESGLIVPVVRDAQNKTLLEISRELGGLMERARQGKLLPDDLAGGTFTLTNVGVFGAGYSFSTPIINQDQSAILQTGAIVERPVVREGQIVVRPIMTVSLTFDHRIMDGEPAARFLYTLRQLMENPALLIL